MEQPSGDLESEAVPASAERAALSRGELFVQPLVPAHVELIRRLQRTIGNSATGRLLRQLGPDAIVGGTPRPHGRDTAASRLPPNVRVAWLLRQPAPGVASGPASAGSAAARAADWRDVVPDAADTAFSSYDSASKTQKLTHTLVKGKAPPTLDPDQQAAAVNACAAVAAYRSTLPEPVTTSGITTSQGAKWAGTSWTRYSGLGKGSRIRPPTRTKKDPDPTDPRTEAEKQAYAAQENYIAWMSAEDKAIGQMAKPTEGGSLAAYEEWLGNRLYFDIGSMEGGFDSINVYDKQIVTWGAGLGGASGYVADAVRSMADSRRVGSGMVVGEQVTKILHSAGIDLEDVPGQAGRSRFVALDTDSRQVYRGNDALHVLKSDNRLLMLLTNLARGELPGLDVDTVVAPDVGPPEVSLREAARLAAFEGQRHVFLHTYAGSGFASAVNELGPTWPYESIEMVLHLNWWGLAGWSQFRDTGGDMKAIIRKAFSLGKHYVNERGGAHVAVRDLASHLYDFGGTASKGCWGEEQVLPPDQLTAGGFYIETKPEVVAKDAVPDTVQNGKVVKKGKPAVAHEDAHYRRLQ